jgi:hypothetical protein
LVRGSSARFRITPPQLVRNCCAQRHSRSLDRRNSIRNVVSPSSKLMLWGCISRWNSGMIDGKCHDPVLVNKLRQQASAGRCQHGPELLLDGFRHR